MDTMQAFEPDEALRATFSPLVNKRGSLEQLWSQLFKPSQSERVQAQVSVTDAANDKS
jgi:hypothetical protein